MTNPRAGARGAANAVLLVAVLALLAHGLARVDLARAVGLLARSGPGLALALAPYALCLALDARGTQLLLGALGERIPLARLARVRLATEAVHLSLPGGAVLADSVNPFLLQQQAGVALGPAAVSVVGRKWLVMRAHGAYLAIGALAGWSALAACSARVLGGPWLPWLVLASAAVPFGLSLAMSGALAGRSTIARLHALLARAPSRALRAWLAERRGVFAAADRHLDALTGSGRGDARRAAAHFLAVWAVEALETLLLLRLVGAEVGLGEAVAIEAGLSLVRSAAIFAPAGIGVQDLGYMAFLSALGVPDAGATSAAFVLLKRGKELAWVAAGYCVWAASRLPTRAAGTGTAGPARLAGAPSP